jgi:hypothetical protein
LKIDRDIDVADMERICGVIDRYRTSGYLFSILDLGTVNHVNFLSLRRLSHSAWQQREAGGDLALSGMSGYLKNIFQIVGVYNDFQYVPSCSTGIQKIQKDRRARHLDVAVIQGKGFKGIL